MRVRKMYKLHVYLVFVVLMHNVLCKTIYLEINNPSKEEIHFLKKYGYLPEPTEDSDFAYTSQSISEGVRKMQAFAGLPQTGELDFTTKQLFKKKRCGVKDIDTAKARSRRYIVQQGWNKKTITYRVLNGSSTLPKHRVETRMAEGLAVWAPHGGLRFSQTLEHADIEVSFSREDHGDGFPFDGPGHVVAHAFPPPHGAMHFDDDEVWGEAGAETADDDVTDFFAVAVHEIGHALGLSHSDVKTSVMYPYYQVPVQKLHIDDIMGMQELYFRDGVPGDVEFARDLGPSPPRPTVADDDNQYPDLCYTNYDALQVIQGKLYVFEEEFVWVIVNKEVEEGYPKRFHEVFIGLPTRINAIRAIYEKLNGNVVIFSGKRYWEFDPTFHLIKVGRLTDYKLPRRVAELTTAFLSNYNNKTYLIDEEWFWRYDDATATIDKGYPKMMSAWRQVPYPIDSAIIWKGDTYFFRGPRFWRFDNTMIQAHPYYPLPTAQVWFPCTSSPDMQQYFTNEIE